MIKYKHEKKALRNNGLANNYKKCNKEWINEIML